MMSTEYRLPPLPLGSRDATILRWLKRAGDPVAAGDPLLIVLNDRVEVALPAMQAGVLEELLAAAGAATTVGDLLATIAPLAASTSSAPPVQAAPTPTERSAAARPPQISPVARRVAASLEVDINGIVGSGVAGRILKADILASLANRRPGVIAVAPVRGSSGDVDSVISLSLTAESPAHSLIRLPAHFLTMPAVLTVIEADMSRVATSIDRLRAGFARRGIKLTYTACIALAIVEALPRHPLLNSAWDDDRILIRRRVHLAVVPPDQRPPALVRDAQDLNLRGLARAIGAIPAGGATTGAASTFTIADMGDRLWAETLPLSARQSAALAIGAIRPRPLVISNRAVDRIAISPLALLTLCYDARALDQCHADAFLRDVKKRLEHFTA